MKPFLKIVDTHQNAAFQVMNVCEPVFFPSWHFHPELEIMLVLEGTGMRFVGDSIERFQPGDLVFFGSEIPHLYRSDEEYYQENSSLLSKAVVIYFKEHFPGDQFWNMPEMAAVKKLMQTARRGIKFTGATRDVLEKHIVQLSRRSQGIDRIIDLLTILKTMATSQDVEVLSGNGFNNNAQATDCARINDVYEFILNNYAENPTLDDVAKIACMSSTAFCRYFKTHTNKTYVQFLNEVKIGNASKMLIDNKLTISQICYQTGFNNFNHFNKLFKRITGYTPSQYQQQYTESPITRAV
jgi:AraC-like DNA-binding protein